MYVLYCVDEVACADPEECADICGNPVGCTDTAYARLVMELLPTGERLLLVLPSNLCTYKPVCIYFGIKLFFPPARAARFNDGGNDCCPHVFSDLHLQQRQHHFYHGSVEDFQIPGIGVGAYDSGQVCDTAGQVAMTQNTVLVAAYLQRFFREPFC